MNHIPIKIALADFRHSTVGTHIDSIPLGIGFIAAYTYFQFGKSEVDLRLYSEIEEFNNDLDRWTPHIVGFSNYCWNTSMSQRMLRFAKKKIPTVLSVIGGPDFPRDVVEQKEYLSKRPDIDICICEEGEFAFSKLVREYGNHGFDIEKLKSQSIEGAAFLRPGTGELIVGEQPPFFKNLDTLPSPYLTGLFDKFLTKEGFTPTLETYRGCPYKCAYCHASDRNNVTAFSLERVKDELTYIAEKTKDTQNKYLLITDANFGMHERDVEIAEHIAFLMEKFDWPHFVKADNGSKGNFARVLKVANILKKRMTIGIPRQSMNEETCKIIKRTNISMEKYKVIMDKFEWHGLKPLCQLIIPMPAETKESYFNGLKILIEAGVKTGTYTLMLLNGTPLASREIRQKYKIKSKFRVIPKEFGEYFKEKCFEVEEVCIETNTFSFDDYIECRGLSLISGIFSSEQFDIMHLHLKELGLSFYDYIYLTLQTVKTEKVCLAEIYNNFTKEIQEELFDSPEKLYGFYSKPANYNSLLSGDKGDNLLRKFMAQSFLIDWDVLLNFAYSILEKMIEDRLPEEISKSLFTVKQWALAVRNINSVFENETFIDSVESMSLPYDVQAWYEQPENSTPLVHYRRPSRYRLFYKKDIIKSFLQESRNLHGDNKYKQLGGMIFKGWPINTLWRNCVKE